MAVKLMVKLITASSKNRTRTLTLDPRKNGLLKNRSVGKSAPQGLETLPFFSSHM